MKKIGLVIIFLATAFFCYFKFIVVKIAYTTFGRDQYFDNAIDTLVFCYTQPPVPNGVNGELFGPVSYFKNYVYFFCFICFVLGVWLILRGLKKKQHNNSTN